MVPLPLCNWQTITCSPDSKYIFVNNNYNSVIKIDIEQDYTLAATYDFPTTHYGTAATNIVDKDGNYLYIVTWDGILVIFDIKTDKLLSELELPQRPRYHYC